MQPKARRISATVFAGAAVFGVALALTAMFAALNSRAAHPPAPVIGQVGDFALTNENGAAVSLANLRGRVWVADIIFTRCPGQCLRMSKQLEGLQAALPSSSQSRLVSLTTDPDFDTPPVLTKYGKRFDADTNRWMFLTGTKKEIANLAVSSLKLSAVEKKPEDRQSPDDLFVHSTVFVVVDKQARLRGVFQTGGDDVEWPVEKEKILACVQQLEREP